MSDYPIDITNETNARITKKITSIEKPKGGYYKLNFEDGTSDLKPRVTTVLHVLDKPALLPWGADIERSYVIEKAADVYKLGGPPTDFKDRVRFHLGDKWDEKEKRWKGGKKAHQMKLKQAGDIGSELHEMVQDELKFRMGIPEHLSKTAGTLEKEEAATLAFMAWEEWAESVNLEPIHVETMLGSVRLGAGGTMDCAAHVTLPAVNLAARIGVLESPIECVFDWKSSKRSKSSPNGIYPEAKIQVAVYRAMAIEMGLASPDAWAAVVRLPKSIDDPCIDEKKLDVAWIEPELADKYAELFVSIVTVHNGMKEYFG